VRWHTQTLTKGALEVPHAYASQTGELV
jgi:hypothetical protein